MSHRSVLFAFTVAAIFAVAMFAYFRSSSRPSTAPQSAAPVSTASSSASESQFLQVGFNFAAPPYMVPNQFADIDPYAPGHPPLGFQVDIFQTALSRAGYTFKPSFQSHARIISDIASGNLDAGATSGPPETGVYYSQPVANCQNYAITKKSSNLVINSIGDLKPLRFVAWQGASTDLGPAFTAVTRDNPSYSEIVDQQAQYTMLAEDKIDAVVIDKFIFQWWHAQRAPKDAAPGEFTYHFIFPGVNSYYMGFRNRTVRDAFDEQLLLMRANGEIDPIIAQYIPDHSPSPAAINKPVPVMFGISRPPFVMDQERRGISVDLAFEAFRRMNLIASPSFGPNQRMELELASGAVDIAVEVQKFSPDFHYSDVFMTYHDVVVTRAADNLDFHDWPDLKDRRVAAWQMARSDLGQRFADAVPRFARYSEFSDQREQVFQWAAGDFDAIVIDQVLLLWILSASSRQFPALNLPKAETLRLRDVPDASNLDYFAAFRSESLRDRFNQALQDIRQDGTYDRIFARYRQ